MALLLRRRPATRRQHVRQVCFCLRCGRNKSPPDHLLFLDYNRFLTPPLLHSASASRTGTCQDDLAWERSRAEFDNFLIPAIFFAVIVLVIGLLALCLRWCCYRRAYARDWQKQALASNKLLRKREFRARLVTEDFVTPETPRDTGAPSKRGGADDVCTEHKAPSQEAMVMATPQLRPPPYRSPPEHDFAGE